MKIDSYIMRLAFEARDWMQSIECLVRHHGLNIPTDLDFTVCEDPAHLNEIQLYFNGISYEWHQYFGFRILGYLKGVRPSSDLTIFAKPVIVDNLDID